MTRLLSIPALCLLGACAAQPALIQDDRIERVVSEVESELPSLARDTAVALLEPGTALVVEGHSDSLGIRRIRARASSGWGRAEMIAWFDDRQRVRRTTTTWRFMERPDEEAWMRLAKQALGVAP